MAPKLLQLKIDPELKNDLREIAEYKGIPVTSFVKLVLKETVRKEKKQIFTDNGLTEEQELEVLKREREAIDAYKEGKMKPKSGKALLKELNA